MERQKRVGLDIFHAKRNSKVYSSTENLKRKDKEKKEKRKEKKKNKEKASALEVKSDAVINEAQCVKNSDLITPSRLHHPPVSASSAPDHPGKGCHPQQTLDDLHLVNSPMLFTSPSTAFPVTWATN